MGKKRKEASTDIEPNNVKKPRIDKRDGSSAKQLKSSNITLSQKSLSSKGNSKKGKMTDNKHQTQLVAKDSVKCQVTHGATEQTKEFGSAAGNLNCILSKFAKQKKTGQGLHVKKQHSVKFVKHKKDKKKAKHIKAPEGLNVAKPSECEAVRKDSGPLNTVQASTKKKKITKKKDLAFPKSAEEMSSNWKNLQKILHIDDKTARKSKKEVHKGQEVKRGTAKPTAKGVSERTSTNAVKQSDPPDIWFDDVDDILIQCSKPKATEGDPSSSQNWDGTNNALVKPSSFEGLTKAVAMDCEMVGVGDDGADSILARVSVVNQYGQCLYDRYVKPTEPVTDYRTKYSGIRPEDIQDGHEFSEVQKEVSDMLKGRILVGHAIHNDLKVLFLDHPRKQIRDTSRYRPFRKVIPGGTPSLKKLSGAILGVKVQEGEHNSIQDAQAAMRLYTMYRQQWEKELRLRKTKAKVMGKLVREEQTADSSGAEQTPSGT